MPPTVTDLALEVRESNQRLSAAIEKLNIEVARINVYLGFIRTSVFVVIPILVTLLLGGVGGSYKIVWDTAQLHDSVEGLKQDVGTLKQDVGTLAEDMKAQQAALRRIEKAVVH
jgi:hypothetical protein